MVKFIHGGDCVMNLYAVQFTSLNSGVKSPTLRFAIPSYSEDDLKIRAQKFGQEYTIVNGPTKLSSDWR